MPTRLLVNVVCVFLHRLFESTLAQLVVVFFQLRAGWCACHVGCLLSRAMLLLPLSSLCIPTFRVVASSSSRCCLLTLRDFARSCSLAAFSAPLFCLHSSSLAALSGLCRLAISRVVETSSSSGAIIVRRSVSPCILSSAASARICPPASAGPVIFDNCSRRVSCPKCGRFELFR